MKNQPAWLSLGLIGMLGIAALAVEYGKSRNIGATHDAAFGGPSRRVPGADLTPDPLLRGYQMTAE